MSFKKGDRVFVLYSGANIEGKFISYDEKNPHQAEVDIPDLGKITVDVNQIGKMNDEDTQDTTENLIERRE